MSGRLFRTSWVAGGIAAAVLAGVLGVVVEMWAAIGDSAISAAGWTAMILGAVATLGLGIGLMSLAFFSSRHGYDEQDRRR